MLVDDKNLARFLEDLKPYITYTGVCDTEGGSSAKIVTVKPGFKLFPGANIIIKFTNQNSATYPTLNVNGSGEFRIVGPFGTIDNIRQTGMLYGYCQLVFDQTPNEDPTDPAVNGNWILMSSQTRPADQIVYSESTSPQNPFVGMVWLKKKVVEQNVANS